MARSTHFSRAAALTALSVTSILAGCGGGGDQGAGRSVIVAAGEPAPVVATEYAFDPATVVVEGGGPVQVELENRGSLAHNLRVLGSDGADIGGTPTFQGGETKAGTVEVDPGTYQMICSVGNHEELGMVGELQVR